MMQLVTTVVVFFLASVTIVSGEVIRQPNGLNPGDQYRLAFVTSGSRDAISDDIDDYNAFVQSAADEAMEVGDWGYDWKAIGSTANVDARDNTGTNLANGDGLPVYRLDGVLLFSDYRNLWRAADLPTEVSLNFSELGTTLPPNDPDGFLLVWTGSTEDGAAAVGPSGNYALGAGFDSIFGYANINNVDMIRAAGPGTLPPDGRLPLYAISEVITAVPEPASTLMLFCVLVAFGPYRRSRILG